MFLSFRASVVKIILLLRREEMANLNQVFLIGRLTRDPELRYVPTGKAVANLGLDTRRVFTTQAGERTEEV